MPAKRWFEVKNSAGNGQRAEVLIYDKIGKDWYSDDGVAAKDFREALAAIPAAQEIDLHINSPGGNVWDGMAIHSMLAARRDKVTAYVDGVAASIASVIALAGHKTVMPKNALMMIHPPSSFCEGDAAKMRAMADKLETHAKAIASVYATKTGKTQEEMLELMNKGETWMTGEDAKAQGLCDEITEEVTISASIEGFSQFRSLPEALREAANKTAPRNQGANIKGNIMNRDEMIALLKARGVEVKDDATDAWLKEQVMNLAKAPKAAVADPPKDGDKIISLSAQLKAVQDRLERQAKADAEKAVQACVDDGRVPAAAKDKWVSRVLADATVLDDLKAMPQNLPGVEGVNVNVVSNDVRNTVTSMQSFLRVGPAAVENATERGLRITEIFRKEREKLLPVLNASTNTISADLKRTLILNESIRAFAIRVLPLRMLSTVFGNVPLQGSDTVTVPYFPLRGDASTNWVAANGYVAAGTAEAGSKKITVDKRKYQMLDFDSSTLQRQPFFDTVRLGQMNAEKLACDVLADILSIVKVAGFANAITAVDAESADSDTIIDLADKCDELQWPTVGRSLITGRALNTGLMKDSAFKNASAFGGTEVIRSGRLPSILGFEYATMPNLPDNGEKLIGFAAFASAILTAFAPVNPAEEVRAALSRYEVITDPETGIALNFRAWGDAQKDVANQVLETAYGYLAGEAAAIVRIPKP